MSVALPKGWVETTFPHVALLNPKSSLDDDTEVAFVPMPHVPTNFSDTLRFEKKLWRDVKRGFTHFRNDDVLFAKITPCFENGKAAIVTGLPNAHGAGSTEFYVLRPVIVPSALLFYWVKTAAFLKTAEAHMTGTVGQKRVPKTIVESHPLPLPPLNEQKRIVAKLDAIMPRIDSVKERLEKIPAILKRFRQSVLTAAVTGKLTEKWREEHPDVESVMMISERMCFKNIGYDLIELPAKWEWQGVEKLVNDDKSAIKAGPFGSSLKKECYVSEGYKVYGQEQVINNDAFFGDYYIDEEKFTEFKNCAVKPYDILISLVGTIGKVLILPENSKKGIINPRLVKITLNKSIYDPFFFKFYFASDLLVSFYRDIVHGSTMDVLNLKIIKSLPFPLPPLDEQKEIVRQVDKLFALADKVEEHYQKARARVDALSQSVLAKAFRGELVPQDPDDEPAEKLLQRIREEKGKMENRLKTASRSARGTRRNGAKTQQTSSKEKQASEP